MHLTVTVKMTADSKEELIETFPSQVEEVKRHFGELAKEGILGPPNCVETRYLVIGGGWRETLETPETTQQGVE